MDDDFPWLDPKDSGYETVPYDPLDDTLKPPPGMECEADPSEDHDASGG